MKPHFALSILSATLGLASSALAADESPRAVTTNPAVAGDGVQVGVAKRDGITISGGETYVTRNGATEKLAKELILPSGIIVRPDGTLSRGGRDETPLRSTQLLTFEGKIVEIPRDPNVNPATPPLPDSPSSISASTTSQGFGARGMTGGAMMNNGNGNKNGGGSVFVGSDGTPFMGRMNADGTITLADGSTVRADSGIRPVIFGQDGTPALGRLNNDGSITQADGTTSFPDGSTRTSDGRMIAAPNNGTNNTNPDQQSLRNAEQNSRLNAEQTNPTQQNNNGTGGTQTNSPNNAGTVNNPNRGAGTAGGTANSPNNAGTVNSPNTGGGNNNTGNNNATGTNANQGGTNNQNNATGGNRNTSPNRNGRGTGAGGAGGSTGGGGGGTGGSTGGGGGGGGAK